MNSLTNELAAESRLFLKNYTNGKTILLIASNEHPMHGIFQPAKGLLQLFFMQVANGTEPHTLWRTYNAARESYVGILAHNLPHAKTVLSQEPDNSAAPEVRHAFDLARNTAHSTMRMLEHMSTLLGDPASYEELIANLKPSLEKLTPSKNWVSKGQLIAFSFEAA